MAPAAHQPSIPTAAQVGRPLNPSAQPFVPKVNPKLPFSPTVKLPHRLIPLSRVYVTWLPVYQPRIHQPAVFPHAPPLLNQPPVQRSQKVVNLQGYRGKKAAFPPRPRRKNQRAMWRAKVGTCNNSSASVPADPAGGGAGDAFAEDTTTLMIRHIPNSMKREDLMKIVDKHCKMENEKMQSQQGSCRSEYDFVYLPIDYSTGGNKGYAFVNFTSVDGAKRMWRAYHLFKWDTCYRSPKICNICPAIIQGKDGLLRSFQKRSFPKDEYHPLIAESAPRDGFNDARFITVGFGRRSTYRQNVSC